MNKNIDFELANLNNEELLELYKIIEEHRDYLEKSIIVLEEESENKVTEDKEEEDNDESTN